MESQLTPEERSGVLRWLGVQTLLPAKDDSAQCLGGIASCCGSIWLGPDSKRVLLADYKQRIFWEEVGEDVPLTEKGMDCLLIPDVAGNVLIQWSDT